MAPEFHKLTRKLSVCSARPMIDRVRRPAANSGDVLRGKTPDSLLLELPLHDSFLETAIGTEEYLLGHSTDEGVVSIVRAVMNSSGRLWCHGEDREG
jgi:hypothetical protein